MPVILALPAIEIAIVALMALLLYYATPLIVKLIAIVIPSNLPVIGDRIVKAVESASSWAQQKMRSAVHAQLVWAGRLVRYPVAAVKGSINAVTGALNAAARMGTHIVRVLIPQATLQVIHYAERLYNAAHAFTVQEISRLRHYAEQLYNRAHAFTVHEISVLRHYAEQLYNRAYAFTVKEVSTAIHYAERLYNAAHAYTLSEVTALTHYVQHLYNEAIAETRSEVSTLSREVDTRFHQAIGYADATAAAAAAGAISTLNGAAAAVLVREWPGLRDDIKTLENVIGTDLANIGSAVRGIDLTKPAEIATGIAVATAASQAALRYMRDCGIPNCKNLGAFGHVLRDLELLIGGEALFGFVREFAHDPEGAAHNVVHEAGGLVNGLTNGFRDLIGL